MANVAGLARPLTTGYVRLRYFSALCCLLLSGMASGQTALTSHQALLRQAEDFVRGELRQESGFRGVTAGPLDARLRLPDCDRVQFFLPNGMDARRLTGQTHIGARCLGASRWSVFIPVKIAIERAYLAASVSLPAGRVLRAEDFALYMGDPSMLPAGVLGDPAEAVGKTLKVALQAGQPVRAEQLSAPVVIQQGQNVRLIFQGGGFTAANEGKAMGRASAGQVVQARTASGIVVSGIAQADGTVLVSP